MNIMCDQAAFEEIINLDEPSIRALIFILRNKNLWPKDFVWNYADCNHCAMGLAYALWQESIPLPLIGNYDLIGKVLGLNTEESSDVFLGDLFHDRWVPKNIQTRTNDMTLVTPEMVADRLSAYIHHDFK